MVSQHPAGRGLGHQRIPNHPPAERSKAGRAEDCGIDDSFFKPMYGLKQNEQAAGGQSDHQGDAHEAGGRTLGGPSVSVTHATLFCRRCLRTNAGSMSTPKPAPVGT